MRKVRTGSGAVAVQVVTRRGRDVVTIDHVGSGHTDAELALLVLAAEDRLRPGQQVLDLGPLERVGSRISDVADWTVEGEQRLAVEAVAGRPRTVAGGGRVLSTSTLLLWEVLTCAYTRLGFDVIGDEVFRALVLARIIEPTFKADTIRVLSEVGVAAPSVNTIYRCLQRCQQKHYRGKLATTCLAHSAATTGHAAFVMYDVTTLLCRRRHKSVYADLLVMPISEVSVQVSRSGRLGRSA